MSEFITFPKPSGASYVIPDVGDNDWGQNVTNFLVAIPNGVVPTAGLFTLTGDLSFGASFGLLSKYFTSGSTNPASAGILRLANVDTIEWRNAANSGNDILALSGDILQYNGANVLVGGGSGFVSSITGTADQVIASSATGAVVLSLPQSIGLEDAPSFAGIELDNHPSAPFLTINSADNGGSVRLQGPATSIANVTWVLPAVQGAANTVLQNNGSGALSWTLPVVTAVGNLTDAGTDGIVVTGGTGAVVGSGTSIAQHVADATHNGYLSSTDWSTFNGKGTGTVTSVSGTANQITSTGGTTPVLSLPSAITLPGSVTLNAGDVVLNTQRSIQFWNGANTFEATVNGGLITTSYTLLLPPAPPSSGQVLTNNTVGANVSLAWTTPTAGTVTSVSGTANQITSTGGATPVLALASPLILPGSLGTKTVFTSNGTFTTPSTSSASTVYEYMIVGAGGGGGGANGASAAAAGGGAGAVAIGTFTGVAASTGITITVSSGGGTGGASTGGTGGTGGSSSIGTPVSITCSGGVGGIGSTSATPNAGQEGGAGGTVTGSPAISITGGRGARSITITGMQMAGNGANSPFGAGGIGGLTNVAQGATAGVGFGSGGGGSILATTAGAVGAPGLVVITQVTP